jgi:glycosyltransferase involved in cell wall biosynthesis
LIRTIIKENIDIAIIPTILLEAGLSRCAVISIGNGGCVEIIPDHTFGIIIKSYNHADIKEAIISFIQDPGYRESASLKLYEKVSRDFSWSRLSTNFIEQLHL